MRYGILGDVTFKKDGTWVTEKQLLARFTVPLTIRSNEPITMSDTLSLKRYVRGRGAQRWEIETNVEPLTASANELFALLVAKGYSEPVQIVMPQNIDHILYNTERSTSVRVNDTEAVAGATIFKIQDSSSTQTLSRRVPVGLFIQFTNHPKIYMVRRIYPDEQRIEIYPPLRRAVNGASIYLGDYRVIAQYQNGTRTSSAYTNLLDAAAWSGLSNAVVMPAYLDTDSIHGMTYQDGILMDLGTLKFVEALS